MVAKTAERRARARWLVLPVVLAIVQIVGSYAAHRGQPERRALDAVAVVLLVLTAATAAWLRSRPVPALVACAVLTLGYMLAGYPYGPVTLTFLIALFWNIQAGHRTAAWTAAGAVFFGHMLGRAASTGEWPSPVIGLAISAWLLVLLVVAEIIRARRERVAERRRAAEEAELRRAGAERLRIAQELHDVVAHHISLINVQAGVALHLVDQRPEQASTALAAIKDASKQALIELRSIVGVLRDNDQAAPREPVPGLDRLDDLVARTSQTGVAVHAVVRGERRPLPTSVDRAAYRIVQEALTNVVRHAQAATATVRLAYGEDLLTVQVDDDGRGHPGEPIAEGNGITGMRERATALGGTLTVTPGVDRGFRVVARLPL
jgi:signal transduction histidine kinase